MLSCAPENQRIIKVNASEGEGTEFIALLRVYMQEAGIETPKQLYRALDGYGPKSSEGRSVSLKTVYAYFEDTKTPQPWFVLACIEVLKLSKKKACELALACLRSYHAR